MSRPVFDYAGMYEKMAREIEHFCTCRHCRRQVEINPADCLRDGWPKCCGETMHVGDLPEDAA